MNPVDHPEREPCYLSTDGRGYLSTLADSIEAIQRGMGGELLEHAREALAPGARALSATEYRWLASRLPEALTDALRVAESRGQRIRTRRKRRPSMLDTGTWARKRYRFREHHVTAVVGLMALPTFEAVCVTGGDHDCGATSSAVHTEGEVTHWIAEHRAQTGHDFYHRTIRATFRAEPGACRPGVVGTCYPRC